MRANRKTAIRSALPSICALLFSVLVTLSGCGNTSDGITAPSASAAVSAETSAGTTDASADIKGETVSQEDAFYYTEEVVYEDPMEDPIGFHVMVGNDNVPIYYEWQITRGFGEGRETLFDREATEITITENGQEQVYYCNAFTFDQNGNAYILFQNWDNDRVMLAAYDSSRNQIGEMVELSGRSANNIMHLRYHDGNVFIVGSDKSLDIRSVSDGTAVDYDFGGLYVYAFDIDPSGYLYVFASTDQKGGSSIIKADMNNGFEVLSSTPVDDMDNPMIRYNEAEKALYAADYERIVRYDENLKAETVLTFGKDSDFILNRTWPGCLNSFDVDSQGNIYIAIEGGQEAVSNRVYKLTKTSGVRPKRVYDNTLTVTAVYKHDYLIDAVRQFENQNKGTQIIWDVMVETQDEYLSGDREGFGQRLAAKLMANDVGDIVASGGNGLVYYDVLHTDVFADLTDFIKNDPNYSVLKKEVLDGLTFDDQLKALPVGVTYPVMAYNKALGDELGFNIKDGTKWSEIIRDAAGILENNPGIRLFEDYSFEAPMIEMLNANIPQLIDFEAKEVNLSQDWFKALVEGYKALYDTGKLVQPKPASWDGIVDENCLFRIDVIDGRYDQDIGLQNRTGFEAQFLPLPDGELSRNGIAYPALMYSISANSENKDLAWGFISTLIGADMQESYNLRSSPVNTDAQNALMERYGEDSPEFVSQFKTVMGRIDFMYDSSYYKQDILNPLVKYLQDEVTLGEALEEAEYNVWLRLNE